MDEWEQYKNQVKNEGGFGKECVVAAEIQALILKAIISKRNSEKISQRELAKICNIPQSTLGRIERGTVSPNLDTLLKIMIPLGLTIKIESI